MDLYIFSSWSLTNIWAGVGARLWAISEKEAENVSGALKKAAVMPIGARGVFYCSEDKSITTPFVILSKPAVSETVSDVWAESWTAPFRIHPLGTPRKRLSKDRFQKELPCLANANGAWTKILLVTPVTVFVPSKVEESDWEVLVQQLADA